MKNTYLIMAVVAICALLFYAGTHIANRGTIKINYKEDQEHSSFTAMYPSEVSDAVISHIKQWANQATQKSGQLPGRLELKFPNGISCRLYAKGRNLEIIADHATNSSAALASLKHEFKMINEVIVAKTNKLR